MNNFLYNLHSQRKRILALIVLISFIFIVLVLRLSFVQLINGQNLQSRALDQWTRDLPLTAERGKIFDTDGSTLAVSYTTYNIYTRGREIKNPELVATTLSELLDIDYKMVLSKVKNKTVSEVLIKMQVESDTAQKIIDKEHKGVYLSENTKRYYPYGDLLTQIIGFTSIDNVGQAGIEAYYNNILKGVNGKSLTQSDLQGTELDNSLKYYIPAISGMDITLTINSKIQLAVEQTLIKLMDEQKAKSTSCIIMNAKTGEIVASATKPSFDLNNVPRDNVELLMETLKNKIVVDIYEPGSTFKTLTMAMCLESGKASLTDRFYCPGYRIVDGERIKCWKSIGHGSQNLTDGLCNSCNCVFMDLAGRLGVDDYYTYAKSFGFGEKTGVEIYGESSGILMNKVNVKNVDLARMGFGQAIAMTQLQLITAICGVVNGGNLMTPYLVKQINDSNGNNIYSAVPTVKRKIVSQDTSNKLNAMLEEVVSKTGKYTFVEGYQIGGKTGTTQKYATGGIAAGKYISSFVGTYPANNPEYVLLLTVDEPGTGAYYGSVVASPYAKEIFSQMFTILNIKPISASVTYEQVSMPLVENLSLTQASSVLKSLGLNVEIQGEGSTIKKQLPPEGTTVYVGESVVLIT